MSYALTTYVIDIDVARAAIGSKDEKLRRMIGGRFKRQLAADDRYFAHEIERGAPTRHEAVRAVIDGGPYDEQYAFQYGYAYQLVCEFYGRACFNNDFSPFRGDWLEQVDAGLKQLGITAVAVTEFGYGSLPAELPRPEHLPCYGEWSAEECRQALAQWEATTPDQRAALEYEVRTAIESCSRWWSDAVAAERGVAGFMS
ncbi:DUF7691 family protein [Marinitenerispora sediminis]|uniref:DUF7691 domain-containing protein n=1 Tax=Marinitenerispora sediminis TaxID=1931232 RepID=A0A368T4T4_9ACTN|nr:hypothetical protein [Marinitenerispora sediminis]RCV50012.1 hypothetical protein DEF28_19195 [Marinitenerispora sediminis]RCV54064.1 hypothetical protein DEF23_16575 [Marinitenerispora sediminis]RCV58557.1 hypothetical protein DEF24_13140 [Marinitenerispora sediminis]